MLRLTLGLNFTMHGLTRFISGIDKFVAGMVTSFENTILPEILVRPFGYMLTYTEFLVDLLLILGLFTRFAATVGALVILALIVGSSLQAKWDTVATQMIYAVFFFLVIHFLENNRYSLDDLRGRKS
ncbi:MAG: DoxX family membrane protein [Cytophagaceae bacterium]|nr:DoxX family membrane protein [Cytophagaceae bacterium]